TRVGFDVTLIGMVAFVVGAMAAGMSGLRTTRAKAYQPTASPQMFWWLGKRTLIMGFGSFFVLMPVSAFLPSMTALVSATGLLLILGLWCLIYSGVTAKNSQKIFLILAMLPFLPLATLVTGGFLGYGTGWVLFVIVFHFVITRHRVRYYVVA